MSYLILSCRRFAVKSRVFAFHIPIPGIIPYLVAASVMPATGIFNEDSSRWDLLMHLLFALALYIPVIFGIICFICCDRTERSQLRAILKRTFQ